MAHCLFKRSAKARVKFSGICCTSNSGTLKFSGKHDNTSVSATGPPVEAPIIIRLGFLNFVPECAVNSAAVGWRVKSMSCGLLSCVCVQADELHCQSLGR